MGIFYNPPQPPTGNNAGTPPDRHVPIGTQGNQPPRYSTALMMVAVLSSWPADLEPRLARPNDQRQKIAPLTLAYGSQPTPSAFISTTELAQIIATWPETWGTQTSRKSAAWSQPPILTVVPYRPLAKEIPSAWEPPWIAPPRPAAIAPLTLPIGSAPPIAGPVNPTEYAQVVASWQVSWDAQSDPKSAAWNVPPVLVSLPYTPPPRAIWTAWEPPWVQPPTPVAIATLTLPTGQQPPLARAALDRPVALASAWTPDPPRPLTLRPTTAWNVPPIQTQPPYTTPPAAIRAAWEEPFRFPQQLVDFAPLSLVYGQAPPPRPALLMAHRVATSAWPADLEPRLGWPNASRSQTARENPFTIPKVIQVTGEALALPRVTNEQVID